ncbi:MAG: single-stranded DNA-binding protein [Bryobacteraceae bacterium]|nr:MAG: single-stranded DNA-binding protein [Bryobacteraceae bacterium]
MANRSVNKVILIGHLGRDAETRYTPTGVPVTRFTLATNRRVKDPNTGEWRDETDWHNVAVWRQDNLAQYLTKGKQVYVEGRLQTRSYEDREGQKRYITEVVADEVFLLGSRGDAAAAGDYSEGSERPAAPPKPRPEPSREEPDLSGPITDDDVPF